MTAEKSNSSGLSEITRIVIFRVTTGITIIGMLFGGLSQLLRADNQVAIFERLDYPLYFMSIIGLSKVLGAITLSIPGIPLLFKISAYAGLVFVAMGAVVSHIITGAPLGALAPLLVAGIGITSCLLNPDLKYAINRTPPASWSDWKSSAS